MQYAAQIATSAKLKVQCMQVVHMRIIELNLPRGTACIKASITQHVAFSASGLAV